MVASPAEITHVPTEIPLGTKIVPNAQILEAISLMAGSFIEDSHARGISDDDVLLVPIMNGASRTSNAFASALTRQGFNRTHEDGLKASTYPAGVVAAQRTRIMSQFKDPEKMKGQHIVIVEDIVDSGTTLRELIALFKEMDVLSVTVVALVVRVAEGTTIDQVMSKSAVNFAAFFYAGLEWFIGFGMDLDELYRALEDVKLIPPQK